MPNENILECQSGSYFGYQSQQPLVFWLTRHTSVYGKLLMPVQLPPRSSLTVLLNGDFVVTRKTGERSVSVAALL